ncbi:MAG: ABC transporter ATP-binding protein [Lachnospiraceae bacterium]
MSKSTKGGNTTIARLMKYVSGTYRLQFIIAVIAIVLSALANTVAPLSLMFIIDDFITPLIGQTTPDYSALLQILLILAIIFYLGVLCTYLYNRLMINISQGVLKRIRDDMFEHMQTLPISFFDSHTHGELMSLYTNDTDALRQMISQSIPMAFSSLFSVISIFIAMLVLSPPLAVIAVVIVIIMFFITKNLGLKSARHFAAQQNELADVTGYIEEQITGQKVVKVFNHEELTKRDFDAINTALSHSIDKANTYANIMMPIINNLGNVQYVLTAIAAGILSIFGVGGITLGVIVSYLQFTKSFTQPFGLIAQQFNAIAMALAGAERIFRMMDEKPETDDGYVELVNASFDENNNIIEESERTGIWAWKHPHHDGTTTYTQLKGDVRFYDMSFGYTDKKMVLHNISLYAKPGQKLAFVGSTGAGKTTITNLINRFYDVQDGKIRYDGININKIKKADLRHSLGIVLQDTHLFSGSIYDNILYGNLTAGKEEVYAAAKLANADDFIRQLPQGYDTPLTHDGESLSQGQRQLLSIARAAIANPPVLILDEATSSIDTRTESIIQRGMDELMKDRTVFVIAHRLSTVRNSNAIIVLEHGEIIERGAHEELLKEKGTYYQLYTGALELS